MPETWLKQIQDKNISDFKSCATFKCFFGWKLKMDDILCRFLDWQNMQSTLHHESYTATWYGSCKRRRGQYMPVVYIYIIYIYSCIIRRHRHLGEWLRTCSRQALLQTMMSSSGTSAKHTQPFMVPGPPPLFQVFDTSWVFPRCWDHFAEIFKVEEKTTKHIIRFIWLKIETPLKGYVFCTFPLPVHFQIDISKWTDLVVKLQIYEFLDQPKGIEFWPLNFWWKSTRSHHSDRILRASSFFENYTLHLFDLRQNSRTTTCFSGIRKHLLISSPNLGR